MRPGVDVLGVRPRKDVEAATSAPSPSNGTPTSFFIASEDAMLGRAFREPTVDGHESNFGVESLQDTLYSVEAEREDEKNDSDGRDGRDGRRRSTLKIPAHGRYTSPGGLERALQAHFKDSSSVHSSIRRTSPTASGSMTSLSQVSPSQGLSLPSSPKSTSTHSSRPLDEDSLDEAANQAILSSEEDEAHSASALQDSAPQLIMPSIQMPSRRPFTERGKATGRLKILIAGDSGVGKTSLIKSIVQSCDDIVHVDPLSPSLPSIDQLRSRRPQSRTKKRLSANSTHQIAEVYASTRAYPAWWTDIEESKVLRKRKSFGESVMERNVCFVDTPGYSSGLSMMDTINSVVQYTEAQLSKATYFASIGESELVGMLSGKGGAQVDVALYMIDQKVTPVDLEFIRRLSALTNVIPVIAKADSMSHEEAQTLKASIAGELVSAGLRPFAFNSGETQVSPPYTVCSAPSSDDDNMDASLLMSPEYVRPLVSSELSFLVQHIFDQENISWLRHFAAKKLVHSQRGLVQPSVTSPFSNLAITSGPSQGNLQNFPSLQVSPSATSQTVVSYATGSSSYVQARIADHTQREEKLAQMRLAKWAGDLQRSLQNERARYEAISRGERAIWLTERLRECVNDGSLVPIRDPEKHALSVRTETRNTSFSNALLDPRDPLGFLGWSDIMRRRGWVAFQVVGGFGVLGAVGIWFMRSWGTVPEASSSWTWTWRSGKA